MATNDEKIHTQVLRGVLKATAVMKLDSSPPAMGQQIHRLVKRISGNEDPYREVKAHFTRYALRLYPECRKGVEQSASPFETALRFAAAANAIDFGAIADVEQPDSQIFILKVKCRVIARHIGCAPGSLVVRDSTADR